MDERKLDQNKIYWIFSLRKNKKENIEDDFNRFLLDDNIILIQEFQKLYKFVFEFESEWQYRSKLKNYSKDNILIWLPSNENISYIDRVVEYLENNSEAHGDYIKIIKDMNSLIE